MSKLLGMAGKEEAFMSLHEKEAAPFLRESYKTPGKLASAPDADKWYATARKLNRIADDLIAGGTGQTALNPWKRHTPEDLAERVRVTYDLCEEQQKCLSDEMHDIESVMGWMQKEVKIGRLTLPGFVDMACGMIDRFQKAVSAFPMPESPFLQLNRMMDKKRARMLKVRTTLMGLTFQKRAFLHAVNEELRHIEALLRAAEEKGKEPALKEAIDTATISLIAMADDILAGGDGTTGKKPWKQFTPEDLSERMNSWTRFLTMRMLCMA